MIQTLEHLNLRVIFVTVPTHDTAVQSRPACLLQCHRTLLNANVVQPLARAVRCWIGFEFIQNFKVLMKRNFHLIFYCFAKKYCQSDEE
jgi:hypothetical protein